MNVLNNLLDFTTQNILICCQGPQTTNYRPYNMMEGSHKAI